MLGGGVTLGNSPGNNDDSAVGRKTGALSMFPDATNRESRVVCRRNWQLLLYFANLYLLLDSYLSA